MASKRRREAHAPRSGGEFASGHRQAHMPGALRPSVRKLGILSKYLTTPHDRQRYNLMLRDLIERGFDEIDAKNTVLGVFIGETFIEEGQADDTARTARKKKEIEDLKRALDIK